MHEVRQEWSRTRARTNNTLARTQARACVWLRVARAECVCVHKMYTHQHAHQTCLRVHANCVHARAHTNTHEHTQTHTNTPKHTQTHSAPGEACQFSGDMAAIPCIPCILGLPNPCIPCIPGLPNPCIPCIHGLPKGDKPTIEFPPPAPAPPAPPPCEPYSD